MKPHTGHRAHAHGLREAGAVLVELAFVTPAVALLLAGLLHFGSTMYVQQVITNASRVGSRRGAQGAATSGDMQTSARNYVQSAGLDTGKLTITATPGSPTADSSCTVSYQFTSTVQSFVDRMTTQPIQGGTGGSGWYATGSAPARALTATTVMRY